MNCVVDASIGEFIILSSSSTELIENLASTEEISEDDGLDWELDSARDEIDAATESYSIEYITKRLAHLIGSESTAVNTVKKCKKIFNIEFTEKTNGNFHYLMTSARYSWWTMMGWIELKWEGRFGLMFYTIEPLLLPAGANQHETRSEKGCERWSGEIDHWGDIMQCPNNK